MPSSKKPPAPRVLWKGAISFGLVHIPVALYAATVEHGIDFDWLDKRSMDPVGYKRVNKKTGREIAREQIVKGVEYEDGQYVVLSNEEISAAYPKTTQTVSIERFVPADSIPFIYLERPYYVAPINRGGKVYALLRDTLKRVGRIGIARVVIQTKEHLAVLVPTGPGMVLNLLRWGSDIRPWKDLPLPGESRKESGVTERELKMAEQLVADMTDDWDPADFEDSFTEKIRQLIDQKVEAGQTEEVTQPEAAEEVEGGKRGGNVVDLTELLQRSLRKNRGKPAAKDDEDAGRARATPARKPARKAAPRKRPAAKSRRSKAAA